MRFWEISPNVGVSSLYVHVAYCFTKPDMSYQNITDSASLALKF